MIDRREEFARKYQRVLTLTEAELTWCKYISTAFLEPFSQTALRFKTVNRHHEAEKHHPSAEGPGTSKRFFRNFVVTRNAWGLFHINSHVAAGSGKEKVMYNTKASAVKSAEALKKKRGIHFSAYKCMRCDGYHLGRNRDNKVPAPSEP